MKVCNGQFTKAIFSAILSPFYADRLYTRYRLYTYIYISVAQEVSEVDLSQIAGVNKRRFQCDLGFQTCLKPHATWRQVFWEMLPKSYRNRR